MRPPVYDSIGRGYRRRRRPDPRIARRIADALAGAERVCNVGAGTGSYEPETGTVVAVEPSREMIAQRTGRAAVVRASAEALPFADGAFDAALAVLTLHHWPDVHAGLREMCRVAPRRVVLTFDPSCIDRFWLVRDYLPAIQQLDQSRTPAVAAVADALAADRVEPVTIPWDCVDGFLAAYWRRPERYLEADVRAPISALALLAEREVNDAMMRLADDLASGAWAQRNDALLARDEMDYGYRLVVADARR